MNQRGDTLRHQWRHHMSNKTAAETKLALAKKLIREAHADPAKRAEILPLLKKLGVAAPTRSKQAVKPETEEFVRWVLSTQTVMNPHEVEAFVSRTLQIKTSPPVKRDTSGPRFKKGDSVLIRAEKHKNSRYDIGNYKLYNGKTGLVTETEGADVLVAFKGEPAPVRFPGGLEKQGVGIYKYQEPYEVKGSAKIEMIYFAGGKPTEDAKVVVDAYMSRGKKTEKRSANYYTGHIVFASVGANGYYFRGFPQQRMQVDPNSEGGFQARTFNPSLGDVFYIGLFGTGRPSGWKEELAALDKVFEEAGGTHSPDAEEKEPEPEDTRSNKEFLDGLDMRMHASKLAKKLVRVAHANPDKRAQILPMIAKLTKAE